MRPTNLCTHCCNKCDVRKSEIEVRHMPGYLQAAAAPSDGCRHYSADKYKNL